MKKNKIFWLFLLVLLFAANQNILKAQTISGLVSITSTEGVNSPTYIGPSATVSGGGNYGGGYLLFDLQAGDQLGFVSDANINAVGAISYTGTTVYLGNGSGRNAIGTIDNVLNGQNGNDLKINFVSEFSNSSFENGIGGWTLGLQYVNLGVTSIAGFVTPNDVTYPANSGGDNEAPWSGASFTHEISNAQYSDGLNSLRLYSNMTTTQGCDVVHGPYVYSDVFQSVANDVITFDWRAYAGSDAYDVFGYIVNINTGATTVVLDQTGAYYGNTNWATASVTIPATGSYRFVFVSGTYDATCGQAAGASLYIDNVRVFGSMVNDGVVANILHTITYQNTCGSSAAARNLVVTAKNAANQTFSGNVPLTFVTYPPVALCKNATVSLNNTGQASITGTDLDNGSYDACPVTLSPAQSTFSCNNIGANQVLLNVYDSYGNLSTCTSTVTVQYTPSAPVVTTTAISGVTATSAISGGTVSNNCEAITARGICWNTTGSPSLSDNFTTDGSGIGSFSSSISGLTVGTTYYVRAYATNSVGTSYGQEYSFVAQLNYCTPTTSSPCVHMWITNVSTSGGTSNFNNSTSCSSSAYGDYSNSYFVTQAQGGNVTMNFSSAGYSMNYSVWIDYNDDGVFASSEQVIALNSGGAMSASASFAVPANAAAGSHKMRVRADYYYNSIVYDPCSMISYGETEDYRMVITAGYPNDLTSLSASSSTICSGNATQLTANGVDGTVYWYDGSCGGTLVGTGNSISVSPSTTTTYFARNFKNNNYSQACVSTTITVNAAPTISCATDITVNNDAGICGAYVNYSAATANGIPTPSISYSNPSGSLFPIGNTTVTATASNTCGNTSCSFIITIVDNENPTISCGGNQTLESCATVIPDYTNTATISDNCGTAGLTIVQSPAAGTTINSGATVTVTLTVTDAANKTANCSFNVTRPNITPIANNDATTVCAGSPVTFSVLGNDSHPQGTALTISEFSNPTSGTLVKNADNTFTYTAANPSASPLTFTYTIKANDGVIANSSNNHYYEWVPSYGISWTQAKADALTKTFNGMQGYLVTVTSAAEMAFVAAKLQGSGWMGASDLNYEGTWRWVTGPEGLENGGLGRHFSNQSKYDWCGAYTSYGVNGNYSNWGGGEPNDCGAYPSQFSPTDVNRVGEHYAHFYGGGIWNDYPNSVGGSITGYIVEYGGLESCTPVLTATATVTINVNPKPVLSATSTNVVCAGGSDGSVDVTATSGTAPYTYLWSNGSTAEDLSNIPVGTYSATVTDANSCSASISKTIIQVDNILPIAIAQNITANLDASGNVVITAAQVNNGSSDNCGIANMTVSPSSFTCANVGANTVTLTVTDVNGNVKSTTAVVTVVDAILPTVLTNNQTIYLDANGQASITVASTNNGSFDNCGIASLVLDNMNFTCSNVGANTVTLTATDVNGNVNTATATITVVDAILPTVITQNATVYLDINGLGSITVPQINNGSFDNCGIASLVLNNTNFSCSNIGANTVTLTATDVNGNINSNTASVTVIDNIAPIMTDCPSNITVNALNNNCFQTVMFVPPTFTDACGVASVVLASGNVVCSPAACCAGKVSGAFPVGVTTVTYTATDNNGNVTVCTFTVIVVDGQAPFVNNCPSNITVNNTATKCQNDQVFWTPPTPSDNCMGWSMTASHFPGQSFPVGVTPITYVVTDAAGNTNSCTFNITVLDNEVPVTICQNATLYLDANGQASITAAQINNGSHDNCGIATLSLSKTNFDCSNVGLNTVILTVTDIHGNSSTCTATITIIDNIAPAAIAQNVTIQLDATGNASVTPAQVNNGSFDNCSIATMTVVPNTFVCSNVGANTVTFTVTDVNGNVSTTTAVITVQDNILPTVLTQNATIYLDANGQASITTALMNNGSFDNCGIATFSLDKLNFDCSNVGLNTVVLTATDVNGNVNSASATVTVVDAILPTVLTQNVSVQLNAAGQASITASMIDNGSFDNCGIASITVAPLNFTCAEFGNNTVTLTVTDVNGNVNTATAIVDVQDVIAPTVITQNLTIQLNAAGQASITASQIDNGSFDNCGIASMTVAPSSFNCDNHGDNTVVLTVTDVHGNVATATAIVSVQDLIAPTVLVQNATIQLDANGQATLTVAQIDNGSFDNCSIASMILDKTQFDCGNVGQNTVILTVTDIHGNVSSATASVLVQDNILPTVITQNISVSLDVNGQASIIASQIDNGSFDNCTIASITVSPSSFTCAEFGNNTVTLTVTDVNGNVNFATAIVNVTDPIFPTALAQNVTVQLNASGIAGVLASQVDNGSFDNCGISSITVSPSNFDCSNLGNNTVTLTVTDVHGNVSTTTAVVTVQDNILPVLTSCPQNITLNANSDNCSAVANWDAPTASDNCTVTLTSNYNPGATFALGSTTVTYTATDASGNSVNCSFVVTVVPTPLVLTSTVSAYNGFNVSCRGGNDGAIDISVDGGCKPYSFMWSNGAQSEDLSGLTAGTYTVTVTDANGNSTQISVTLTEATPLVVNAGLDQEICKGATAQFGATAAGGVLPYTYSWTPAGSLTNAGISNPISSSLFTTNYTVTVKDANNCASYDEVLLTVNPLPTVTISVNPQSTWCDENAITAVSSIAGSTFEWSNGELTSTIYLSMNNNASGVYSVYATDPKGCKSATPATYNYQPKNMLNSYTIIGFDNVNLGNNNYVVNGSVGVTKVNGQFNIGCNSEVQGANAFAMADHVVKHNTSLLPLSYSDPAVVTLPAMQYNLSNVNYTNKYVSNNQTITVTNNNINLTVGENATVILTGNTFGKIKIGKGSKVTFTSSSIDIQEMEIDESYSSKKGLIVFSQDASVRIKKTFEVEEFNTINPTQKKVWFYIGCNDNPSKSGDCSDSRNGCSPGELKVQGNGITFNGYVYVPHGQIHVMNCSSNKYPVNMNGRFIAEKVFSNGNYIYWNWWNCTSISAGSKLGDDESENETITSKDNMKMKVYPNPASNHIAVDFTVIENGVAQIQIINTMGAVVATTTHDNSSNTEVNQVTFDVSGLAAGVYFIKLQSGENTKVERLIITK